VSNSNDDDRTVVVNPASLPPRMPDAEDDDTPSDRTVIMKPSQRAREAAAALNAERRRHKEDQAAEMAADTVDFDVTQGMVTESPAEAAPAPEAPGRKGLPWLVGFAIGAIVMVAVIVAALTLI
jgi:hypothetical protein